MNPSLSHMADIPRVRGLYTQLAQSLHSLQRDRQASALELANITAEIRNVKRSLDESQPELARYLVNPLHHILI